MTDMTDDRILAEFRAAGALLEGHFILSSGLRSSVYLQCALVLSDPVRADRLCKALAEKVHAEIGDGIDLVVSPAMGGVVVGYEMGRQLGLRSIFSERIDGTFRFRRGFAIPKGARCLMVEDVVTTGLSSRECMDAIAAEGGVVVGAASLVDRSGGKVSFDVPFVPLLTLEVPVYAPDNLPEELAAIEAVKPGSRGLS